MPNTTTWIKIVGVPSGNFEDRLPRQEFHGLVLPTITPNGDERGSYIVYLLDALPIINLNRPILAVWLEQEYPEEARSSTRLIFEAEVCLEVHEDEPVLNFA
jgi:hypothetical protein